MIILLVALSVVNLQILTATEPDSPAAVPGLQRALLRICAGILRVELLWRRRESVLTSYPLFFAAFLFLSGNMSVCFFSGLAAGEEVHYI